MTKAGCAINGSALYKIEKGVPRRRITVDEHVAFASVFEVPMEDLLTPPQLLEDRRGLELVSAFFDAESRRRGAEAAWRAAGATLWIYLEQHPRTRDALESQLAALAEDPNEVSDFFEGLSEAVTYLLGHDTWDVLEDAELAVQVSTAIEEQARLMTPIDHEES
jgi:hypothetical protein